MVRTRFAPSPTGYLHIGGVRTALFNWLFARQHGGQFILRIDDTDQQRNVSEALQPILEGFRWLGLNWDEGPDVGGPHGPYYQSQKLVRYHAAVEELLAKGLAYWDYATPEELKVEREAAEKDKKLFVYSRNWMADSAPQRARFEGEGRSGVVRLKMPRSGTCTLTDHVRGVVEVDWATEQDHVIQRADGTVLYNLANVVDDFDMKITHVIRAEEHLSNTPRQLFILEGLSYPRPEYAHVPFVAEPGSKNKLSKRKIPQYLKNPDFKKVYDHAKAIADRMGVTTSPDSFNPVLIDFYREVGYLPDAILNYLVLLGWSLDDHTEEFSREQMISLFSLDRVNKSPASFDPKKLFAFQERYLKVLPQDEKVARSLTYLQRAGLVHEPVSDAVREKLRQIVIQAGHRLVVEGDILDYSYFFVADRDLQYDEKAFEKLIRKAPAPDWLRELHKTLSELESFDAETLKQHVEDLAARHGVKSGPVSQSLRVAVTGKDVGFGTYETLAIIGRDQCVQRVSLALSRLN